MKLDLDVIRTDGGTQSRSEISIDVVEDYAEKMRQGKEFPAIVVFFDGKSYWLADGFHRLEAARRARPDRPLEAHIIPGFRADAQWYSFGVNKTHGLRRTNEDKARAVKAALRHPQGMSKSDRDIAHHVGVTSATVARYRRELAATLGGLESSLRTGRDGRTINTANIGRSPKRDNVPVSGRRTTLKVHLPVRLSDPVPSVTVMPLPRDPVMAARALIGLFGTNYLNSLAAELSRHLGRESQANQGI